MPSGIPPGGIQYDDLSPNGKQTVRHGASQLLVLCLTVRQLAHLTVCLLFMIYCFLTVCLLSFHSLNHTVCLLWDTRIVYL